MFVWFTVNWTEKLYGHQENQKNKLVAKGSLGLLVSNVFKHHYLLYVLCNGEINSFLQWLGFLAGSNIIVWLFVSCCYSDFDAMRWSSMNLHWNYWNELNLQGKGRETFPHIRRKDAKIMHGSFHGSFSAR